MNLKSLIILIVAIVLGGLAYYLSSQPKSTVATANTYLIPSLAVNLNSVDNLTIHEAGGALLASLSKKEKMWVVDNRDGYEANFSTIRETFNNLSEAKLIEAKTSNPENYPKLQVENIEELNSQGVQFSIHGLDEDVKIIAGGDGSSPNTQYIRRVGEEQSWLINKNLKLKRDVTLWLRKDLFDIPPEQIKNISIHHVDGNVIEIENKGTDDYEFFLLNELPDGKKVSESEIYQVANALSSLEIKDVASFSSLGLDKTNFVVTKFNTFDGLTITANTYIDDIQSHTLFDIQFNLENVVEMDSQESETNLISNPDAANKLADATQQRIKGWAYVLPTITQEALVKNIESFILDENNS